jgi:hypothetical protein
MLAIFSTPTLTLPHQGGGISGVIGQPPAPLYKGGDLHRFPPFEKGE